jgi:lysophospholipase L1-like esterase
MRLRGSWRKRREREASSVARGPFVAYRTDLRKMKARGGVPGRAGALAVFAAFALALAAFAFALEALDRSARAGTTRRTYTVAAIGDSLTDPRSQGGLYLRYLHDRCPASRFDSYGKGGEMVNQMRRRFARDVFGDPALSPDDPRARRPGYTHVIVFGGVNDLYSDLTAHRSVDRITADLSAMYRAARERGLRVIAVTVAPWGGFHRYYDASRAATTAELNRWILVQRDVHAVDFAIDAHTLLACGDPDALCARYAAPFGDGIHFGPEGHRRLADALFADVFADCQ